MQSESAKSGSSWKRTMAICQRRQVTHGTASARSTICYRDRRRGSFAVRPVALRSGRGSRACMRDDRPAAVNAGSARSFRR